MSDSILFKQVSIANEDNSELLVSDVLIEDGIIKSVSSNLTPPDNSRTIEASGKVLLPGLFDVHVHLRALPQLRSDDAV